MDAVTLRWLIVAELAVAVLFGALILRPDAWILWREIAAAGIIAVILIPLAASLYLPRAGRLHRSAHVRQHRRV
jgi:hypothetical protein